MTIDKTQEQWIKSVIREVADFPKPGIGFKDLTTLFADPKAFGFVLDAMTESARELNPTAIVGIEARGFILAPYIAQKLGVAFVPVRKPGKLPWQVERQSYALEYGEDTVEMHKDAVGKDDRVVIIDDLMATGGTACATKMLVQKVGATVVGAGFVIELGFLDGRKALGDTKVFSIITY